MSARTDTGSGGGGGNKPKTNPIVINPITPKPSVLPSISPTPSKPSLPAWTPPSNPSKPSYTPSTPSTPSKPSTPSTPSVTTPSTPTSNPISSVYKPEAAQKIIDNMYSLNPIGTGTSFTKAKQLNNDLISDPNFYKSFQEFKNQKNNPIVEEPKQETPSNYYGNVNNGGTTQNNGYYDDLLKMFMEQNNAARQSMLDAILSNLGAVKGEYKRQIQDIVDQYQQLINQNEVARDRTRRRVKESQANRGQLGSGLGRQEELALNTSYDSNNAQLESARENAISQIQGLIAQAEAEANQNRATVENNYNNALLNWKLANQ